MLKIMKDLPDNVLGVTAEGEITAADYETVLIPAVEEKLKTNKKLRMLYQLGNSFESFDLGAMVDDAKIGIKHASAWDKVAFVSDHHYVNTLKFFMHLMPYDVRIFKNADLEAAKKWISMEPTEHTSMVADEMKKINTEFPLSGGENE